MVLVAADRVKETSTTNGTGTYSLAGAVAGFRTFVAGVGNGNRCVYVVTDGTDWEINEGVVTDAAPDTLTRARLLASSTGSAINWAAGTRTLFCAASALSIRDVVAPRGHLWDLTMSNGPVDTTNDVTVAAGEAVSEDGERLMVLGSAITKQIDAVWAVGNNAGGLNTGVVANATWYEVHLIMREDTGVVDAMFTTTANRATLPTNYTKQRRIGWVRRGTATNLQFVQTDDRFMLASAINDIAVSKATAAALAAVTAPPNSIALVRAIADMSTNVNVNAVVLLSSPDESDQAPNVATGLGSLGYWDLATGVGVSHFEIRVDGSSQIRHRSSVAILALDVSTYGWIDQRRKMSAT